MEDIIINFISRFIPEKSKNDDNIFYQSVLLISAHIFSIIFLLVFILIHLLIQNYFEVYSLIFSLLIFIISLSLYPKSGNNVIFGNLIIAGGFLSFLFISITDGGIFAPVIPWFTAVSLTGFIFANRKSGYFWSILTVLTIISLFILNQVGINLPAHFPKKYSVFNTFTSFLGSSIYLILIILSYEFLSSKKNFKLNNLLIQNRERREELSQQQEEILAQRDTLLDSEQRIRNILESLPDAVFMIDEYGKVSFWNDVIAEMTGINAEDIIGKGNYEYAKPFYNEARPILIDLTQIDDDFLKENYSSIIKTKNILQAETYVPSLRGKERYLVGRASSLFDSKGKYAGAVEIIHDISKRRKNLEKIKEQRKELERLSLVASKTDNAISVMDAKGYFQWINTAFETKYGYDLEALKENRGENIVEVSNNPEIKDILEKVILEKKPVSYENKDIDANNEVIYTQTMLSPVFNADNEVEQIIAIDSDISILKTTLDELKQSKEELSQQQEEILAQRDLVLDSEHRIRNILESLPDAVFLIDEHGKVSFWNDVIAEMTGVKAKDIIGKGNYEYAKPFYNEARPILIDLTQIDDDYLKKNYTGIIKNKNILQAETYVPSLQGKERYLIGRASSLFDSKGNFTGAVEIIHDITERKKNLEKIEVQKKNIEASINYAKHIQQAVFPSTEILKTYFDDYFIYFKPRDIVSGDFYWLAEIKNQLIVVAADCTGHGVPGAFMSLLGISYLNEIVFEHNIYSPENIINSLKAKIISSLHQDKNTAKDGMDMAICKIDKKNKKIEYSGARNPFLIIRNNEIIEYKADRMPVGFYHKIDVPGFVKHEISYHGNDKFYLFSDGFQDQLSYNGKIYSRRFKELLLNISTLDFEKQKTELNNFFTEWKGNYPQTDDVLVIGFKIK